VQNDNFRVVFGRTVRRLRLRLGLSQEKFAERCRLHRTYIGDIERGERNVSLENIIKIARGLGVSPSRLLKGIR
jgi:transcriptional regulator with XRE-family HTH domain